MKDIGSFGVIVQHVLVFILIVAMPLWDRYEIPRLKASTEPRKKIRFYRKVVAASWICAAVAVLTVGLVSAFRIHKAPGEIAWLDSGSRGAMVLQGITAGMLIAILLPAVMALKSEKIRNKAAKAAKKLAFLLPSTGEERRWWWFVCLTAGICEEVVYRGFLLHYWHVMPFHLSLTWALVVSSVIFGIAHLYQGIAGGVQTAVIGFVLGGVFLMTGNLLVPIVLHAVLDLRVLAMVPEGFEKAAE
jgi:membrane protease YdiL (CAAX protease family)